MSLPFRPMTRPLPTLQVLMLCARPERLDAVERGVAAWPVHGAVQRVGGAFQALRTARETQAHLLIVDAAACDRHAQSLLRHAERSLPGLQVMVFDDFHVPADTAHATAWPWSALPRVLEAWVELHLNGIDDGPGAC